MSDIKLPPANTLQPDESGMTAWHPAFDRLSVDKLPGGRRHLRLIVEDKLVYQRTLEKTEAMHLAALLRD